MSHLVGLVRPYTQLVITEVAGTSGHDLQRKVRLLRFKETRRRVDTHGYLDDLEQ